VASPKGRDAPASFQKFCRLLHQDVFLIHKRPEQVVAACLDGLSHAERQELKAFLEKSLRKNTAAELKSLLRRCQADFYFSSAGAHAFLSATYEQL
jgi:hypothetical protein